MLQDCNNIVALSKLHMNKKHDVAMPKHCGSAVVKHYNVTLLPSFAIATSHHCNAAMLD